MSKKYLSLEEAANLLSMQPEELVRMREKGDIRGFADRGTWKFKVEDVEAMVRMRQADSDPEVPLFSPGDIADDSSGDLDLPMMVDDEDDEEPLMMVDEAGDEDDEPLMMVDDEDDDDEDAVMIADDGEYDEYDDDDAIMVDDEADDDESLISLDDTEDEDDDAPVMVAEDDDTPDFSGVELAGDSAIELDSDSADLTDDSAELVLEDEASDVEDDLSTSDSDVRLVGGSDLSENDLDMVLADDSDVRLVGLDSESEVRLEAPSASDYSVSETLSEIEIDGGDGDDSDSDVQLVGGDSDSDVQLIGDTSDSDVQLIGGGDSDSDIQLSVDSGDEDTLSDMNVLAPESDMSMSPAESGLLASFESGRLESPLGADSQSADSDINLLAGDSVDDSDSDVSLVDGSDSDVSLLAGDEDAIALDPMRDSGEHASVLTDESGISLGADSAMLLAQESGISLEGPSDSGMGMADADDDEGLTLALDDDDSGISLDAGDSGISLEAADSGISLEAFEDSGISLEGDDDFGGTIPMMDAIDDGDDSPSTQFEIPAIEDDSAYELNLGGDDDDLEDTRTLELGELSDEGSFDDAVFEMDDEEEEEAYVSDAFDDDDLDLDADAFEDEDEFVEVDGDVFDTVEDGPKFGAAARGVPVETEWGMLEFSMLTIASIFMIVCGIVLTDLVKNTATAADPSPISGAVLDALGGMYK
ncbi:MAG: hypothetical protein KDA58_07610 [Planctomycetaceae bacterium]|nr:hypothetical protein [Planctomycetaceae bacterium]